MTFLLFLILSCFVGLFSIALFLFLEVLRVQKERVETLKETRRLIGGSVKENMRKS
jgi:hypothetical protein